MSIFKTRRNCRLCGNKKLEHVLKFKPTPPANAFIPKTKLDVPQEHFPLDVYQCTHCSHVQLLDVLDPQLLFENYVYVSGTSSVFVKHFEEYAKKIISDFEVPAGSFVLDVGSNDGTLLKFLQEAGMRVLGIDPAVEIAKKTTQSGIETLPLFFTAELAGHILQERGPAAVITANNVFAHVDDLVGFAQGVRKLLTDDGIFVFEVSYFVDVYEKTLFDTIYHEHLSYHTVGPLKPFFAAQGLELIEAMRVDSHGGSLRGIVQRAGGFRMVGRSVSELIRLEHELGLDRPETLKRFAAKIDGLKKELQELLCDLKQRGKRIVGYGAPAKATTLMHHFELGADMLDFIIDDSPLKQGKYSTGLHIPVLPSSALNVAKPDYVLILAWNFAEPIMENNRAFSEAGGKFIIPLPKIEIK